MIRSDLFYLIYRKRLNRTAVRIVEFCL